MVYNSHGNRDAEEISRVTELGPYTAVTLYSPFHIFLQFCFKGSPHLLLANFLLLLASDFHVHFAFTLSLQFEVTSGRMQGNKLPI